MLQNFLHGMVVAVCAMLAMATAPAVYGYGVSFGVNKAEAAAGVPPPTPEACARSASGLVAAASRGGARVIYYFYNTDHPLLFVAIYAKSEKADVSAQDKKKFVALVKEITAQWQRK